MGALQLRRGLKANLPASAAVGEPLIATDTRELYIGTGSSVYKIGDVVFSNVSPTLEADKIWVNTATNDIYRADITGGTWVKCAGTVDLSGYLPTSVLSTDATLGGVLADDAKIASQKAVKTYVDNAVSAIKIPQEWPDSVAAIINDPPATPANGERYIVGAAPTGAFVGKENNIAEWNGVAWIFTVPTTGTFISVDADTTGLYYFGGTNWVKKGFELTTAGPGLVVNAGQVSIGPSFAGAGLNWDGVNGTLSVGTLDGGTF